MSAIWGAIDLSGNTIGEEIKKIMRGAFTHCRIDRYEEIHKDITAFKKQLLESFK